VTPSSAPIGNAFTLGGEGFGPYNGSNTRVLIGGVAAPLTLWNDSTISGKLPYVSTGTASVVVERDAGGYTARSAAASIDINAPQISTMTPGHGEAGVAFVLLGAGLGAYNSSLINGKPSTRVMVGDAVAALSFWSGAEIRGLIPDELPDGPYVVAVELETTGGVSRSNEVGFDVGSGIPIAALGGGAPVVILGSEAALPLSADSGGKVTAPDRTSVSVPPNALEEETLITLLNPAEGKELRDAAAEKKHLKCLGRPVDFGPDGLQFAEEVTLTLPYDLAALGGADPASLKVAYWNRDTGVWEMLKSEVSEAKKTVRAKTSHFSVYQVVDPNPGVVSIPGLAAALGTFEFRDMYVFPNPSRGGERPTIRMQAGLADSVKFRIFDVAGNAIQQNTVFGARLFDDGNGKGAQYTFDYTWETSGVGTGVYTFVVTAQKAGKPDIVKTGRLAIIK
jgi:hypothetical protein